MAALIKGELREHLCPDGFVFDINLEKCDYPVKVNCTGRPLLREYSTQKQSFDLKIEKACSESD